jgi:hypothetical protein
VRVLAFAVRSWRMAKAAFPVVHATKGPSGCQGKNTQGRGGPTGLFMG